MLDTLAHSNVLAVDLGEVKQIESIDFECLASEVLAGLLGVTVVEGELKEEPPVIAELSFGEIIFEEAENTLTASVNAVNTTDSYVEAEMIIAHYSKDGRLKASDKVTHLIKFGTDSYSISYTPAEAEEDDYVKVFMWNSINGMKSYTEYGKKAL